MQEDDPKKRYIPTSEALFSYNKMINLCIHSIKEDPQEGKDYFKEFMMFITNEYHQIATLFTPDFGVYKSDDKVNLLKGYELRRFVRENLIYDLFSTMFKYMNKEISDVKIRVKVAHARQLFLGLVGLANCEAFVAAAYER